MPTFNAFPALSVRGPTLPDTASNAMRMMNMMAQQQAAQRQAQQAQQSMEIARAGEERAAAKGKQEFRDAEYKYYRDMTPAVMRGGAPAYQQWLGAIRTTSPEIADIFETAMPVNSFEPNAFLKMVMNVDQAVSKTFSTPIASFQIGQSGELYGAQTGGTEPTYMTRGAEMPNPLIPGDSARVGTATVEPGVSMPPPASTTPAILMDPQAAAQLPPLVKGEGPRLWGDALRNGTISATNAQRLMNALPPEKHAAFLDAFKNQGVQIVPDAALQPQSFEVPAGGNDAMFNQARWDYESPRPGMNALYEGEAIPMANAIAAGAAPELTQAQYAGTVGRPATVQPKMPPSAQVPLPRVSGESTAEETGKLKPRVIYEPQITGGNERVKRLEKLRGDLPAARSETETFMSDLEQKIGAIDEYLRNPYRNSIIGPVEGNLPRLLQFGERADTQAQWDFITNNSVLQKLIDDRKSTETGASPQGIVSDRDLAVAASAANKLRQTGEPKTQEKELRRIRNVWYETMQRARRTFLDTYREVMEPQFAVREPRVPATYSPVPAPTSDDIAILRRNMDKSDFVEGFKKNFGEKAFRDAVRGR